MSLSRKKIAIFIMPRSSSAWFGAEAMWVSAAGWAEAAKRKFGEAVVVTSDKIATPSEVLKYPLPPPQPVQKFAMGRKMFSFLPAFLKIFINDLLTWKNSRDWEILAQVNNSEEEVAFVWEKHDLFNGPGYKLAQRLGVPFISYVHAPVVWEAKKWGVNRYSWGGYLERKEAAALKKADFVAVVSEEVKQKIIELGVEKKRIFVSPMAVDPEHFRVREPAEIALTKKNLSLEDKFIIGWTGSFRSFHGINHLIKAFEEITRNFPECVLLLVGDGLDRKDSEVLAKELAISDKIIFTGKKDFSEIPDFVSVFDVAVVSARSSEGFHYSPLKLREYLAAGKPVLAPNAGEIPILFQNEVHLKLFEAGEVESLKNGMEYFLNDALRRKRISDSGKDLVLRTGTWDVELEKSLNFMQNFITLKNKKEKSLR